MEEYTDNSQKTDKPWLFQKGQSGNPGGRPKGKSMKEYAREYLSSMTDEERIDFMNGIPKVDIWKLAEGNPESKTENNNTHTIVTLTEEEKVKLNTLL